MLVFIFIYIWTHKQNFKVIHDSVCCEILKFIFVCCHRNTDLNTAKFFMTLYIFQHAYLVRDVKGCVPQQHKHFAPYLFVGLLYPHVATDHRTLLCRCHQHLQHHNYQVRITIWSWHCPWFQLYKL